MTRAQRSSFRDRESVRYIHATHIDSVQIVGARLRGAITNFIDQAPGLLFLLHINSAQKTAGCALIPCYYLRHA